MQTFHGTLQSTSSADVPLVVSIQFDNGRIRMWSDRRRIGSWDASDVQITRESIFRFVIKIDDEEYRFSPDDPTEFVNHVDVAIDLTAVEKPRFGLAQRIREMEAS